MCLVSDAAHCIYIISTLLDTNLHFQELNIKNQTVWLNVQVCIRRKGF